MSTNVEALKGLYTALGGSAEDVAAADTTVEVLNAISAKYEGESDAALNPDAISNIAAVAENIGGGGGSSVKTVNVHFINNNTSKAASVNYIGMRDGSVVYDNTSVRKQSTADGVGAVLASTIGEGEDFVLLEIGLTSGAPSVVCTSEKSDDMNSWMSKDESNVQHVYVLYPTGVPDDDTITITIS